MTSLDGYILKLLDEYSKTEDAGEKDFLIKKYDTAKMMLAYQNSTVEDAPVIPRILPLHKMSILSKIKLDFFVCLKLRRRLRGVRSRSRFLNLSSPSARFI